MSALAFLASLGTGYLREDEKKSERAKEDAREARRIQREDTADARATELYDAGKAERARVTADRDLIRNAAQPVPIAPEATMPATMDARDIGQPGEAPVPVTGYKVGAARFAERAAAEAESGRQTQARVAAALDTVDPAGAQGRKTQAMQGQVAQMQLTAAEEASVQRDWTKRANAAFVQSGSWDAVTKFMTESKADGLDGNSQWKHTVSPDGKTVTVFPVGPDGKQLAQGFTKPNDQKGRQQLMLDLDAGTPVSAKLADLRAEENAASMRADREADNKRLDAQNERMYQVALRTASAAAQRAAPGPAPIWNKEADEFLLKQYGTKDEATGAAALDGNGVQFAKIVALAASQKFGGDTTRAIAYAIDQDNTLREAAKKQAAESGGKIQPQDALRALRASTMQQLFSPGQQPAKEEPPKKPESPGAFAQLAARGVDAVKGAFNSSQAEGAAYQAIDARVRQAGAGGPPLTPAEVAEASRFAIGVPN